MPAPASASPSSDASSPTGPASPPNSAPASPPDSDTSSNKRRGGGPINQGRVDRASPRPIAADPLSLRRAVPVAADRHDGDMALELLLLRAVVAVVFTAHAAQNL